MKILNSYKMVGETSLRRQDEIVYNFRKRDSKMFKYSLEMIYENTK